MQEEPVQDRIKIICGLNWIGHVKNVGGQDNEENTQGRHEVIQGRGTDEAREGAETMTTNLYKKNGPYREKLTCFLFRDR